MISSVSKLFCCQPNDSNGERMKRLTTDSNFLTPISTINSPSQKFLSLIQPNEGDIVTIGLKALDKLSKYNIIKIAFASTHCLMLIDSEHEKFLTGFGSNLIGQLGLDIIHQDINHNYHQHLTIIQPALIKKKKIIDFATCEKYSIILIDGLENSKRSLISFGSNPWDNTNNNKATVVKEMQIEIDLFSITKVYLTFNGSMLILQSTTHGLYAKDNSNSSNHKFKLLNQFNHKIISLSIMKNVIVVALSNNTIVTFGSNSHINNDDTTLQRKISSNSNQAILSNHFIKKIICGSNHTLILCQDGAVFSFGENKYNQCTKDSKEYLHEPHPVIFEDNEQSIIVDIACGETFSLAITNNGNVFIWGTSGFFFAQEETVTGPKKIDKLYLDNIKSISAFGNSALCFGETCEVY